MAEEFAIKVQDVSKTFKLPHEKSTSVKSTVVNFYRRKKTYELQEALKDISFEIKKGEFFGIVGRNGSGKSTLLKLLAGIYTPSSGQVHVRGKLTPFIELGVGFNPELTGRENIFLNGALLGFNRKEMSAMYADIVEFAELERFMDQKLKNYSSGMQVRLAFSIAIRAKSDILLIDEVLAVGDAAFQTKCFDYFQKLKRQDTTVVFVSHDRGALERFCDRGILINDGELIDQGDIKQVLQSYATIVLGELDKSKQEAGTGALKLGSHAQIKDVHTMDDRGEAKHKFTYGEKIGITYKVEVKTAIENPIIGITIWKKDVEQAIYATNTLIAGNSKTGNFRAGDTILFKTVLPDGLNDGEYYVEAALANESVTVFYGQLSRAERFFISGSNNPHSLINSLNGVEIQTSHGK